MPAAGGGGNPGFVCLSSASQSLNIWRLKIQILRPQWYLYSPRDPPSGTDWPTVQLLSLKTKTDILKCIKIKNIS